VTAYRFLLLGCLVLSLGLAGCGRRAELDTPYQAAVDARREARLNKQPLPPEPKRPAEDRPFILDPLL
jgi:predicted small lipoprotein YifL